MKESILVRNLSAIQSVTRLSEYQGYWRDIKEFTLVINRSAAHSVTRCSLWQIFWRLIKESTLMKNPLAAKGVITNVNNQLHWRHTKESTPINQLLTMWLQMLYLRQSTMPVRIYSATKSVITNANNQLHWRHTKESTSMRNHPAAQSVTRYSVSQDARMAFTNMLGRSQDQQYIRKELCRDQNLSNDFSG